MARPASSGPRVRVAALIVVDGRVVVVRHRAGDREYHLLPGGGVDYRETLEHALIREVREETGLEISVGAPLIVNDTIDPLGTRHVVNITFAASVDAGTITDEHSDPRVVGVDLVEPTSLIDLDLRPPIAELISHAVLHGASFRAVYAGSLFREERSPS